MTKLICGIDDAGRGPVIGPMVLAGVLIEESKQEDLKSIGVKDSKLLTPRKRFFLYGKIKKFVKAYKIVKAEPYEIDKLNHHGINLNYLEALKAAEIINYLKPEKIFLDCPSPNLKAWKNDVYENIKHKNVELVVEHKADQKFPIVSAASIIAKVIRDYEIKKIKEKIGVDFGSGYSSDVRTIEFLKHNIDKYPEIFRKTWSTYSNKKEGKKQKSLKEF
ncbi:ribonuclease HII [Candidatus Woesearchaeota archaeon]|nr:ribonuclease HII [Candidatus Woesearchaeota archaeon]